MNVLQRKWAILGPATAAVAAVLMLLRLGAGLGVLWTWARLCLGFPYGLDHVEGLLFGFLRELEAGRPLFTPFDEAPWFVCNYPPLYVLVCRALHFLDPSPLVIGRGLSMASTLAIAVACGWVVLRARPPRAADGGGTARVAPFVGAATAALCFLNLPIVARWGVLMRVDMLALAASTIGLALGLRADRSLRQGLAAVGFFLFAAYTKQSMVVAPAAFFLVLVTRRLRRALGLAVAYGGLGLGIFLIWNALEGGLVASHLVTANRNEFSIELACYWIDFVLRGQTRWVVAGLLAAFASLGALLVAPRGERPFAPGLLLAYFVLAWVSSIGAGKIGSNLNYFLEAGTASCLLVGHAVSRFDPRGRAGFWRSIVLLPILLLLPRLELQDLPGGAASATGGGVLDRRNQDLIVENLKSVPGEILSEDMLLPCLLGRPLGFQPFAMQQLWKQGLFDASPIVERLEAGGYAVVLLGFDAAQPPPYQVMFPDPVVHAVAGRYRLRYRLGGYWIYSPRLPGEPESGR